jgi:hypothetical protein
MAAQWQGKQLVLLRFDLNGDVLPNADLTVEEFERIIGVEDEFFYISFQDPVREDMGIARVKQDQARAFFQRYPLEE